MDNSKKKNTTTRRDNKTGSKPSLGKDGRWVSTVMLGYKDDGKPQKKTVHAKTEAECKKKMKDFLKAYNQNNCVIKHNLATDFFQHWFVDCKKDKIADSSYDRLWCSYEYHILPFIKNRQLAQITPKLIEQIINHANDENMSYSTIKKIYEVLRPALNVAVKEKSIPENPFFNANLINERKVNKNTKKIQIYSPSEIEKLLNAIDENYKNTKRVTYTRFPMFKFLINTGLRASECLALKWGDLKVDDNDKYSIVINKSLSRSAIRDENNNVIGRTVTEKETKTKAGERIVPLNTKAVQALSQTKEVNKILNISCTTKSYIFATKNNKASTINNVQTSFRALLKVAGIENNFGIHSLRHFFGTSLANNKNIPIKDVSELMGHTDVYFTLNTYVHGNIESKRNAVDTL